MGAGAYTVQYGAFSGPRSEVRRNGSGRRPLQIVEQQKVRRRGCRCRRCGGRGRAADGRRACSACGSAGTDMPFDPSGRCTDTRPPASSRCDNRADSWPAPADQTARCARPECGRQHRLQQLPERGKVRLAAHLFRRDAGQRDIEWIKVRLRVDKRVKAPARSRRARSR